MARPLKLTPEIIGRIADAVRAGNTREAAAASVGIGETTLYRWLQRARRGAGGPFREFWEALDKADAEAEMAMVAVVTTAAKTNYKAAAWWLERRRPDTWGRKERVDLELLLQREAAAMAKDFPDLDVEDVVRDAQRILRRL